MKLGLKSNKSDPIVEKVSREGIFGKMLKDVDLTKPFEKTEVQTEATVVFRDPKLLNDKLILAASLGEVDQIKEALAEGADVNAVDVDNESTTPLLEALRENRPEAVDILLSSNADVNQPDMVGYTPLMAAAQHCPDKAEAIISKGANINAKGGEGTTALMLVAGDRNAEMVKLLLDKGADITIQDDDFETAEMFAARNGHTIISAMFEVHKENAAALAEAQKAVK
jgi:ankyrin repeat protein